MRCNIGTFCQRRFESIEAYKRVNASSAIVEPKHVQYICPVLISLVQFSNEFM